MTTSRTGALLRRSANLGRQHTQHLHRHMSVPSSLHRCVQATLLASCTFYHLCGSRSVGSPANCSSGPMPAQLDQGHRSYEHIRASNQVQLYAGYLRTVLTARGVEHSACIPLLKDAAPHQSQNNTACRWRHCRIPPRVGRWSLPATRLLGLLVQLGCLAIQGLVSQPTLTTVPYCLARCWCCQSSRATLLC